MIFQHLSVSLCAFATDSSMCFQGIIKILIQFHIHPQNYTLCLSLCGIQQNGQYCIMPPAKLTCLYFSTAVWSDEKYLKNHVKKLLCKRILERERVFQMYYLIHMNHNHERESFIVFLSLFRMCLNFSVSLQSS